MQPTTFAKEMQPHLRRYFSRRLANAAIVDDLVQEVWVRYLEKAPPLRNPRAYMFSIARHLLVDQYRTSNSVPDRLDPEALAAPSGRRSGLADCLGGLLFALAPDARRRLVEAHQKGKSAAAIAREGGLPASTVRSELARSRRVLAARLKGCCPGGLHNVLANCDQ